MSKQVSFTATSEPADPIDDLFPADEAPATPDEVREKYLSRASSGYTKLRRSFVQVPPTASQSSRPGMLQHFGRNHRAAVLYLAVLANWPWLLREDDPLPADAWIRFLTCDDSSALTWTPQSLSHAWGVLEDLKLVTRLPKGRLKYIQPLNESGRGGAYSIPVGAVSDSYLIIPDEFWVKQLHGALSWPALAVLLILLKETGVTPTSPLSVDRAQGWYGISRTTTEQGLSELRSRGLVESKIRYVKDADASGGRRLTSIHALLGDFSTARREQLRAEAKDRVVRRPQFTAGPHGKEAEDGDKAPEPTGGP